MNHYKYMYMYIRTPIMELNLSSLTATQKHLGRDPYPHIRTYSYMMEHAGVLQWTHLEKP